MTTTTSARRVLALLAALLLAATVLIVDRAPLASADPVTATHSSNAFDITRTVSNGTPTVGDVIEVRTQLESSRYLVYEVRDFTPACMEYVSGSAEANKGGDIEVNGDRVKWSRGLGRQVDPFIITAEYTVTCAPGNHATGGTYFKRAPLGSSSLGNNSMGPTITVQQVQSSVDLGAAPTSVEVGEQVSLNATTTGIPNGEDVQLLVDGVAVGSPATVTGGSVSFLAWTPTTPGDYEFTARYDGSTNVAGSTSTPVAVSVSKVSTTVELEVGTPAFTGSVVPLTATTTGVPDGDTVQFLVNGAVHGTAQVEDGSALYTEWIPQDAGDYAVQANFVTTNTLSGSSSGQSMVTVTDPVQQTSTTLDVNPSPVAGQVSTLTATVTDGNDGDTVAFTNSGNPIGTATVTDGVATYDWTVPTGLAAQQYSLRADYAGSEGYAPSASEPVTGTVGKVQTQLSEVSAPATAEVNEQLQLSATVTGGHSGAQVEFRDGETVLCAVTTGSGPTASCYWTPTAVGAYDVTAHYLGTDTTSASQSPSATAIEVGATASSVELTGPDSIQLGQSADLEITTTGVADGQTVDIVVGEDTIVGTATVSGGAATYTWTPSEVDTYTLRVVYGGAETVAPSESDPVVITVAPVATEVSAVIAPDEATVGQQITLSATVTGGTAGTQVEFRDGETLLCSGTLAADGTVICEWTPTAVGAVDITAHYPGNGTTSPSQSPSATTVEVGATESSLTLTGPASALVGQTAELTIEAAGIDDGEDVDIVVGETTIGTATVTDGAATFAWTPTEAGTVAIRAEYAGSDTVAPSESAPLTVAVEVSTITSDVTPSLGATVGQPVSLSATVDGGTPGVSVEFRAGETVLCDAALTEDGTVTCEWTPAAAGAFAVTAHYAGDQTTTASQSSTPTSVVVGQAASTVTLTGPDFVEPGQPVDLMIGTTGIADGQQVDIEVDGVVVDTVTVTGDEATFSWTPDAVDTYTVKAIYRGSDDVAGSESDELTVTVTAQATQTSPVTASSDAVVGQPVTLSATVTRGTSGLPVEFRDGDTVLCTADLGEDGTVSCDWTPTAAGAVNVRAHYPGDDTTTSSRSPQTTTVSVGRTAATVTVDVTGPVVIGQSVTLGVDTTGIPDGEVIELRVDDAVVGSPTVTDGRAEYTWTVTAPAGQRTISAGYAGSDTVAESESDPVTIEVGVSATSTSDVTAPSDATAGEPVQLSATVTGGTAGEMVEFRDGTTVLCTGRLAADRTVGCPWTPAAAGTVNVTAHYPGDDATAASASDTATAVVVNEAPDTEAPDVPAGITVAPQPATVGQTVTVSGDAEADSTVSVMVDGVEVCEVTATDGTFSCEFTATEEMDGQPITVTATDAAGNTSPAGEGGTLQVQPEAVDPTEPTLTLTPAQPVVGEPVQIEVTGDVGDELVIVSGDDEICAVTLDEDGTATCEWIPADEGEVTLQVTVGDQTVEKTVTVRPADDNGEGGDDDGEGDDDGSGSLDMGSLGSLAGGTGGSSGSLGSLSSLAG